ncbi:hypothetical protein CDAR_18761 [Caerostris darwini]|uniref:Uncharacterized protein n=1 Tax=Caerostris darwini TaxID=1538125 RepID=A0AAV4WB56_9ARAC|nr:hypothetical protein CDAR_18761 [Caerostris darwini]
MKKKHQTIAASKAITNKEENGNLKRSEVKRNTAKRYFRLHVKKRNNETFEEKRNLDHTMPENEGWLMYEKHPAASSQIEEEKKKSYNYDPPLKINSTFPDHCGVRGGKKRKKRSKIKKRCPEMCDE